MNNNQSAASNSDSDNPSIVDILIARQNAKRDHINTIKQSMNAKYNEQTSFYLLMFKAVIAMTLIVLLGCLIAAGSAKHKSQPQLEKGESAEMTVHVGEKP